MRRTRVIFRVRVAPPHVPVFGPGLAVALFLGLGAWGALLAFRTPAPGDGRVRETSRRSSKVQASGTPPWARSIADQA